MSKLQQIKVAQLSARKSKATDVATLLTTIIGEAEMIGKSAGNRESTDAEVLQVLKKFEKGMLETMGYLTSGQSTSDMLLDKIIAINNELNIVRTFLPAKLSEEQVLDDIKFLIGSKGLALEQKSLGVITKTLKEMYGGQFDGQQVSTIFKGLLA